MRLLKEIFVKTAVPFFFLWLAPLAFCQDATSPKLATTQTGVTVTQAPAAAKPAKPETPPANPQEPVSKSATKLDPGKEAAIRKLFEIQGTRKAMEQVIAGMSTNMKPTLSKMLPPGEYQDKLIGLFFEKFQSKLKVDDLLDLTIPIYDKYFAKEDIDGLGQFYQTPLGKKVISVLPEVLIESQTAAMNMGEQMGRQAMLEVLAEHPDLAKALEDAGARKN
jgi:uncharacterized protein